VQVPQVDDHAAVVRAVPGRAVAAGSHRHGHAGAGRVPQRGGDPGGIARSHHDVRLADRKHGRGGLVVTVLPWHEVIQVQAGVAVHLARKRGEPVPPALLAIEEAGADAARELRSTLGVLRADEGCDGSGLAHLDSLVSRARAAGQPVTLTVTGTAWPLPPDVDQAAYRIVQEALTNVSRHGGQAPACVRLAYGIGTLTVQVDDDGDGLRRPAHGEPANSEPASLAQGPGLGLVGMRERVSALGGRLHAGPRTGGGFRVRAEIPVQALS
jgi:signal transduction histidine kinase